MNRLKFYRVFWILLVAIAGASFGGWAQSNFRVVPPSEIVIPGNIKFCADGSAYRTIDIKYSWTRVDGTTVGNWFPRALTFGSDGCAVQPYTDVQYAGDWEITHIRFSDTELWWPVNPVALFRLFRPSPYPNPLGLRTEFPSLTIVPGTLRWCARGGAGMTIDAKGIWRHDGVDTDVLYTPFLTLGPDGCAEKLYDNPSSAGTYILGYVRNSLNGPNGDWVRALDFNSATVRNPQPNPSALRADDPTDITLPGSIRYCAAGGAGMTVDLRGVWSHGGIDESFEAQPGLNLGPDGCQTVSYSDPRTAGTYKLQSMRNVFNRPNGAWVTINPPVVVTLRTTGPPTITGLSQDLIRNEQTTDITLTGTNLSDVRVSILTDGLEGRVAPGVSLQSQGYTEAVVRIDATDPNVLHYYTLVVNNSQGSDHKPFRVIPKFRARWDALTPGNPSTGNVGDPKRSYVFEVSGYNLRDVEIRSDPPGRVTFSNLDTSDDTTLHGIMEVLPNVPPGPVTLYFEDAGRSCTPDRYEDCAAQITIQPSAGAASADKNLLEVMADEGVPALYLAGGGEAGGFAVNANWGTQESETDGVRRCVFGPRRIFSKRFTHGFTFCKNSTSFDLACLQNMDQGQRADISAFAISFWFEIDLGLVWWGDAFCFPRSVPSVCVKGTAGAEIPGCCGPVGVSFDFCSGRPEDFNPRPGQVNTINFGSTTGCFSIVSQEPNPVGGVKSAQIQMDGCCPDTVQVSTDGTAFNNTRFYHTFNLTEPAAQVSPACRLRIVEPARATTAYITTTPDMPTWTARAELSQGDISGVRMLWDAEYYYKPNSRNAEVLPFNAVVDTWEGRGGTTTPSDNPYPWDGGMIGGTVKLRAESDTVPRLTAANQFQKIYGTNPGRDRIHTWIDIMTTDPIRRNILKHIGCHESGGPGYGPRQFRAPRENGQGPPEWGFPNGYGIMQKDPPNTLYDIFDWEVNVVAGNNVYEQKLREARDWHIGERARINQDRPPDQQCPVGSITPLSETQDDGGIPMVMREALRRYNGCREYKWEMNGGPNCAGRPVRIDHYRDADYHRVCRRWRDTWNYTTQVLTCQ